MALGDIAQGTGRTQIAHRGTLDMVQDIIGHGHEGVFLTIHLAVFLNEGQTVYIGVDHDTQVVTALGNLAHDAATRKWALRIASRSTSSRASTLSIWRWSKLSSLM